MGGLKSWCLRVKFAGNVWPREWVTKDLRINQPEWGNAIFNRPIESLEFALPTGHRVTLSGMEQFNFFVEAVEDSSRSNAQIQAFWLLGKFPNKAVVDCWRIGNGRVDHMHKPFGQEWGGTATRGWKPGTIGGEAFSAVLTS